MSGEPPARRTSRRRFLTTAGAAAGGVLLSADVVEARRPSSQELSVMRSPSLRPLPAALDRREGRASGATAGSATVVDTAVGFERFAAGETDVVHASRPMLPGEAEAAAANGVRYAGVESAVDGLALLTNPDRGWRRCLDETQQTRRLRDDADPQQWTELVDSAGPAVASADEVAESVDGAAPLPPSGGAVVVRGVRADQYATGFGGLSPYEVAAADLKPIDGPIDEDGPHPLLARLRYTYVDEAALRDADARALVRSLASRTRAVLGNRTPFADPFDRIDAAGDRASRLPN